MRCADGSFYLIVRKLNSKSSAFSALHYCRAEGAKFDFKVALNFKICLHIRDEEVIKSLLNYLNLNQNYSLNLLTTGSET